MPASLPPVVKPRVLLLGRLYPPRRGSSGRLLRELARALARDGWDVRVLAADAAASDDFDGPVRVTRLAAPDPDGMTAVRYNLRMLGRFFWAARRAARKTDLIITLSDPPMLGVIGGWIASSRRMPHIHWCHDVYPDLLPVAGIKVSDLFYRLLFRLSRRAMNRAARVVVTGRCMARHLAQTGVDDRRMILIPCWPELTMNPQVRAGDVNPAPVDAALLGDTGSSLLAPAPKFRVLYIGTVGYAQPIETILDAATILESMHPEIEFIFIGDEKSQRVVNEEKARRGLDNIRVLPFQPQSRLRDIMESGDVHIMSMKHEAAGLMVPAKFYAALASARPCILVGPTACEVARVITDYGAGVVIPQRAAQDLAQAIIDYRLREDLWFAAQSGAARAAAAYTAEDMLRLWVKKVRETIGG